LRWAPALSRGPDLAFQSFGATTYPTALSGLWITGIKKGLAASGTQLGLHVSKARARVTEAP
jgi:hypothetical protein